MDALPEELVEDMLLGLEEEFSVNGARSPRVGRDVNLYVEGAHERTRQRSTPNCASGSVAYSSRNLESDLPWRC